MLGTIEDTNKINCKGNTKERTFSGDSAVRKQSKSLSVIMAVSKNGSSDHVHRRDLLSDGVGSDSREKPIRK